MEETITVASEYECNDGRVGDVVATFEYEPWRRVHRPAGGVSELEPELTGEVTVTFILKESCDVDVFDELTKEEQGRLSRKAHVAAVAWVAEREEWEDVYPAEEF